MSRAWLALERSLVVSFPGSSNRVEAAILGSGCPCPSVQAILSDRSDAIAGEHDIANPIPAAKIQFDNITHPPTTPRSLSSVSPPLQLKQRRKQEVQRATSRRIGKDDVVRNGMPIVEINRLRSGIVHRDLLQV